MTRVVVRVHDRVVAGTMRAPFRLSDVASGAVIGLSPTEREDIGACLGAALFFAVCRGRACAVHAHGETDAAAIFEPT